MEPIRALKFRRFWPPEIGVRRVWSSRIAAKQIWSELTALAARLMVAATAAVSKAKAPTE